MADTPYVPPPINEFYSELGEDGKCKNESHVPVFIDGKKAGCGSSSFFRDYYVAGTGVGTVPFIQGTVDQIYSMLYGELPDGEYYEIGDLNKDGVNEVYSYTFNETGVKVKQSVYGYDDDGNVTTTSYSDWSAPDLSELIEKYGEDAVNDLKGKYDELVDFIGNIPEDPLGSIKKMAEVFIEGATGIDPACSGAAGPGTETELETWILDCVNMGILVDIGIPSLPGLGGIFKSTTLRDIKAAAEKVGSTLEDFINGNPTCGENNDQECTPEQILEDLGDWVVNGVKDIFGDAEGEIDIESILGKLGGIFGPVLSGIIYDQFKDLINGEIEDVIGVPVIPISQGCTGTQEGLVDYNDGKGCVEPCPSDPRFSKDSSYCVEDPFDETKCVEEDYFNENQDACVTAGYVNCTGGENSSGQETTGGIIKGSINDCDVIQDPQCSDVGTYNPDSGECDCPEGYEYAVETGGTCGEKSGDGTYDPVCTEPRPSGPLTFELQSQQRAWNEKCLETHCTDGTKIPESGVCEGEGGNGTDGGNGDDLCDDGSEPFYINFDDDKDGAFTDPRDGKSYTYDPCDQTQPPVEVDPEDNDTDNGNGFVVKCEEPKLGFTPSFDLELNAAYAAYSAKYDDECGTGEPPVGPTEPCPNFNGVEGPRDAEGNCYDCTDPANALVCGWVECDDGTMAPTLEDCGTGTTPCDQQDRVTNEDGSCGECKPGFIEDPEGFDQCIQAPPECNDCTCAEYAADNPKECTTCPEGQSYCDSTGPCETAENCPDGPEPPVTPPPETGGGGGGGGGGGMFQPYTFAIAADPQLQTRQEFPITDFLAGIFTGAGGGKA